MIICEAKITKDLDRDSPSTFSGGEGRLAVLKALGKLDLQFWYGRFTEIY